MLITPIKSKIAQDFYEQAVSRIRAAELPLGDLIGAGENLRLLGEHALSAALYRNWISFNSDDAVLYAAYFNYGVALRDAGDFCGAILALKECIRIKPDFHPAYINLGRAFEDSGQLGAAVKEWLTLADSLSAVNGSTLKHKVLALQQTGRVLEAAHSPEAAEDALRQSIELVTPSQTEAMQHWISLRQGQCKWPVIVGSEFISEKALLAGISPLSLSNYGDDPMFQLAHAHHYNKQTIGRPKPVLRPARATGEKRKLRIGYVSSDMREHAVGFALTDVFEQHDRAQFEIFAYYCGIARPDPTKERIKAAACRWIDINGMDDDQAAHAIAQDEIDILVDLNGYTKDARTPVFARRPAPIAINWFGYPGSMGSPYHHYLIADPYIIPPENEIYYSEKVLRLDCYQPNDRKRPVASQRPARAECGLPENAFVYCSFNGMQKLTPLVFERWTTILKEVPNSVLWLLSGGEATNARVQSHAAERGLDPERIIFAEKRPNPQHLARYPIADLFLDSLPYGAHTTAADALWMGVPVLTLPGRSFASRVCASVVRAAGVGELICASPEDYVARAIAFGRDPSTLAPFKQRLIEGRETSLLFDTPRLVRDLEALYRQAWAEYENGTLPTPDFSNLDTYHEIGLELDQKNTELLGEGAYRALYKTKLSEWNAFSALRSDARMWKEA